MIGQKRKAEQNQDFLPHENHYKKAIIQPVFNYNSASLYKPIKSN